MKILLSPAKSLELKALPYGIEPTVPRFEKEINSLANKLKKKSVKAIGELMHLSEDLSNLNYNRYQNWQFPAVPNNSNASCVSSFTGEVYKGLDICTLNEIDLQFAQNNLRILSGLYGILRPFDLMYPYRLEMGTKFQVTPKVKNLYQFWGDKIAKQLKEDMGEEEVIVNLASNEYFKAVNTKTLNKTIITPVFKDFKNGTYKIVMMYAKHQRGEMARYIIKNKLKNPDEMKLYNGGGYSYDENLSSENEWVFTR